jgi:hypothetical protein
LKWLRKVARTFSGFGHSSIAMADTSQPSGSSNPLPPPALYLPQIKDTIPEEKKKQSKYYKVNQSINDI